MKKRPGLAHFFKKYRKTLNYIGREPWFSGYERRLINVQEVVGSKPVTTWTDPSHHLLLLKSFTAEEFRKFI